MPRHRLIPLLLATTALAACGGSGGDDAAPRAATEATAAPAETPVIEKVTGEPTPTPEIPRNKLSLPKIKAPNAPAPAQLVVRDVKTGSGATAVRGKTLYVDYVSAHYDTGKPFDSSWETGRPFPFILGAEQVVPGWDEGLVGMQVGGRRELIVPPDKAYGDHGLSGTVVPGETLMFVVDLLAVH